MSYKPMYDDKIIVMLCFIKINLIYLIQKTSINFKKLYENFYGKHNLPIQTFKMYNWN